MCLGLGLQTAKANANADADAYGYGGRFFKCKLSQIAHCPMCPV
jgi:hypothetical protein